jgi:hypothetical protein
MHSNVVGFDGLESGSKVADSRINSRNHLQFHIYIPQIKFILMAHRKLVGETSTDLDISRRENFLIPFINNSRKSGWDINRVIMPCSG